MSYSLVWRPAKQMDDIAGEPFDCWREDDGEASTTFHRTPDGFLLRFLEGADFEIDLARRIVTCTPLPEVSEDYVRNIFSNQIMPLVWTYEGLPVLHASCVVIDGYAYGFLGPSGRGKSTLAAAFASQGHAFLTDDGMLIESDDKGFQVRPYLPSVRLMPDSKDALFGDEAVAEPDDGEWAPKSRIVASPRLPHADAPAPLKAIYVLENDGAIETTFEPLTVSAGLDALLKNSFLLDSRDKLRIRKHFRAMADLAETFPMVRMDYPRDLTRLSEVVSAIVSHARKTGGQP